MSMVNQAIVIATQQALIGHTWAADRVFRQPVSPLDEVLRQDDGDQMPALAVYVENSSADVPGRQSQGNASSLVLKVFVYLAPGMVKLPDGVVYAFNTSNAGLLLDVICRQIDAAFHPSTQRTWVDVWRKIVTNITRRETHYLLYEIENAVKVPVAELTYSISAIPEPNFFADPTVAWQMLDSALRQIPDEGTMLADLFKSLIVDPSTVPDYAALQANFGLTTAALKATGLAPYDFASVTNAGSTPVLTQVIPDGEIDTVGIGSVP